jgi:hypothetical protein
VRCVGGGWVRECSYGRRVAFLPAPTSAGASLPCAHASCGSPDTPGPTRRRFIEQETIDRRAAPCEPTLPKALCDDAAGGRVGDGPGSRSSRVRKTESTGGSRRWEDETGDRRSHPPTRPAAATASDPLASRAKITLRHERATHLGLTPRPPRSFLDVTRSRSRRLALLALLLVLAGAYGHRLRASVACGSATARRTVSATGATTLASGSWPVPLRSPVPLHSASVRTMRSRRSGPAADRSCSCRRRTVIPAVRPSRVYRL